MFSGSSVSTFLQLVVVPDVIAFAVLKKILAIRNSHFNLQEYLTTYIIWGGGWVPGGMLKL